MKRVAGFIVLVAVIAGMAGLVGGGRFAPASHFRQSDTVVWYCAGQAVNEHADPYRVEPLRSCEIRYDPSRSYPWVEPAPLPGYTLAAFSLLARLPFPLARMLWFYVLVIAILVTALLLARLARIPVLPALLCLAAADAYFNLFYGELPPLAIGALVVSAALGASRRYTAAALAAAVSMIEPHIGLPACLSMFLWWPRTRVPLVISGAVVAGISLAAIGLGENIEYFHTLLPQQAASEIAAQDQYSLTRMLHVLGVSDRLALLTGSLSYLCMTVLGVSIARRLAAAAESDALIVLLPPALGLLGGPFVHDLEMAAAIPAAILLASSARMPLGLRAFALVAVVFPWHAWNLRQAAEQLGVLEIAAAGAALFIATRRQPLAARVTAVGAGVLLCVALASAIELVPRVKVGPPTTVTAAASAPADMSSANWAASVSRDRSYSTPDVRDVAEKVPVWLGLIALAWMGLAAAAPGAAIGGGAAKGPFSGLGRRRYPAGDHA
jgi:hypothetical protein